MKIDIEPDESEMTAYVPEAQVDEVEEWAKEHSVESILLGAFGDLKNIIAYDPATGMTYVGPKYAIHFPDISKSLSILFKIRFGGDS